MLDVKKTLTKLLGVVEVRTTVWTNSNPSSAFAAQTINLDLSGYKAIEIVFANSSTANQGGVIIKMIPATGASLTVLTNNTTNTTGLRQRTCSATSTGVSFSAARNGSNADNGVVIPLHIYGIIGGGY